MAGLYRVLKKIGNLYKVELLDLIKVYPIYYGSRHEPEYNILNGVVIEEGYVRVTMRV